MDSKILNNIITYAPSSSDELINFAFKYKKILIAVNAEKILHASQESRLIINSNVGYPDGIGAVWALKKKGCKSTIKIPGCELWLEIVKKFYKHKTFYLIGGTENVINQTVSKLKEEYIDIKISNFRNGYFSSEAEKFYLINDILKHKPDIIFVAMGSPSQEFLMDRIQNQHRAVYMGLGVALMFTLKMSKERQNGG